MSRLAEIVSAIREGGLLVQSPDVLPEIELVTDDSRLVVSGAVFCAVEGTEQDGHQFVPAAVEAGAVAVIVTRELDATVPQIVVSDGRGAAGLAAGVWFGFPARDLAMVGVTGTNGKTTTVSLVRHLLNGEHSAASVGTLGAIDGAGEQLLGYGTLTTPGTVELQAVLADLRARGARYVALEASSHALHQRRLGPTSLDVAVYTNLTHEHLDYHESLEEYRDAKARLSDYVRPGGAEVVNVDEPEWRNLPERDGLLRVRFGVEGPGDLTAKGIESDARGSRFALVIEGHSYHLRLPLPGRFNVSNALAAAGAARALGIDPELIADRLATAPPVSGRMESIVASRYTVIRDYAHTPDALERVLIALRPLTPGRLVVLFGAGGDRDRVKRPIMGRIASEFADSVVVTSDNPRTEDPERIMDEIGRGIDGDGVTRIADRETAIRHAVSMLQEGDCLLLAGKGHESYQVIGTTRSPFDEVAIVRDAVRVRGQR